MQVDEVQFDMEADISQCFSGGAKMQPRVEEEVESFESVNSGSEDDDSEELASVCPKQVVSYCIVLNQNILSLTEIMIP
jgi:hypothetical protein